MCVCVCAGGFTSHSVLCVHFCTKIYPLAVVSKQQKTKTKKGTRERSEFELLCYFELMIYCRFGCRCCYCCVLDGFRLWFWVSYQTTNQETHVEVQMELKGELFSFTNLLANKTRKLQFLKVLQNFLVKRHILQDMFHNILVNNSHLLLLVFLFFPSHQSISTNKELLIIFYFFFLLRFDLAFM